LFSVALSRILKLKGYIIKVYQVNLLNYFYQQVLSGKNKEYIFSNNYIYVYLKKYMKKLEL